MRSLLLPFLLSLLLWVAYFGSITATILAKSDLEKCTRAKLKDDIQCGNKIVVELSIAAGKHADEDAIMATLDAVKNSTSGEVQILKDPQTIKISKSAVFMGYPIKFEQNFNRRVQELGTGMKQCRDHPCYAYNDRGERIYPEQTGFCCECTGLTRSDHRGMHPNCNLFLETGTSIFKAPYGTRHCLQFHPDWFPTYTVSEGQMEFKITIEVFIGYDTLLSKLVLSPWDLLAATSDKSVTARLHGDLAGYKQMPEFQSVYFSRPPKTVILNRSDWVVIDKIKYSLDGRVCDRIGTLYTAFCNQISRCTSPFNSCLRFQLQDYIEEDSSRLLKGLRPRFALTQYGEFDYTNEGSYSRFLLPLQEITKSIITLELNADNVKFLVNRSPGKILSMTTPKFEALSRDGVAKIVVSNVGELLAGFFLGVNCSSGIKAMVLSLEPNKPKTTEFSLSTTSDKAQALECVARLRDSAGEIADQVSSMVFITATTYINFSKFAVQDNNPLGETEGFFANILSGIMNLMKAAVQSVTNLGKGVFGGIFGGFFALLQSNFGGALSLFSPKKGEVGDACSACGPVEVLCIASNFCYGRIVIIVGMLIVFLGALVMCGCTKLIFQCQKSKPSEDSGALESKEGNNADVDNMNANDTLSIRNGLPPFMQPQWPQSSTQYPMMYGGGAYTY
ncbi:hypothetical protein GOP47_0024802 [Adiantum capillus-veneris]|uniref:Generative cell specific-1/HAP2 domain-containing protein n=1 Tax=Adiantum capillus-veneris TaxID=13818 RepID=A0A9D4Z4N7_ADICA|nr:hypothetical protein GOP47_0024802 [Adiantum capillus-veneris]